MTEKMKDGIIRRGSTISYVVRERDPETGHTKPRWVSKNDAGVPFKTKAAAKKARDAHRNAVNTNTHVVPRDMKVGPFLDQWLEGHRSQLKPSTAASYKQKIESYLKPMLGNELVQQLTPGRLSVVWKKLHESGGKGGKPLSFRSVEFTKAVLRRAMQDAVLDRVILTNPVLNSKAPKRDGTAQHTTWTGEQAQSFLDAVADTRWAPLWGLALGTGMRRGELMALSWDHLDLDTRVVSVELSTVQIGSELVTGTPKNHERRKVKIDPRTVAVLRAWRREQAQERLQWGPAYVDTGGVVFTAEDGSRPTPNSISKAFQRAQVGLGLPRLTFHEMRHSHASLLLGKGVPVHIVAARLGHKDATVTLSVYAHAIPGDDTSAADVFSEAVWGAS